MTAMSLGRWLAACLGVIGASACIVSPTSSKRATLLLPSGDVLTGSASATINGQYYVKNDRMNCYGSFDGRSAVGVSFTAGRPAPVTVHCSNGRSGSGQDDLWGSGVAELTFKDGSKARISLAEGS